MNKNTLMNKDIDKVILASKSPRRRELLAQVGIDYQVIPSDCKEIITKTEPSEIVCELSRQKAFDVLGKLHAESFPGIPFTSDVTGLTTDISSYTVVGSDTIVYFDGQVMGKPQNESDAFRTLKMLSGKTHSVFTGVTVIRCCPDREPVAESFFEETKVTFYDVEDGEINDYIATGDPMDKAGSYGIQGCGAFLVRKIDGDYFTVMGLPIAHLVRVLKEK